ncbi:MAG: c-type cytochrome [Isosphaeraceae bacterium]
MTTFAWLLMCGFLPASADEPTPSIVWPAGPMEVRAAFPKPIPEMNLVGKAITFRTEPGFEGTLGIAAVKRLDEGRTLALFTDPHAAPAKFTPPGMPSYDLSGVEASWSEGQDEEPRSKTWLPGLDTAAVRKATAGSVEHDRLFASLAKPGRLALKAQLAMKPGKQAIQIFANVPIEAEMGNLNGKGQVISFDFEATEFPEELTLIVPTGDPVPVLKATAGAQPLPPGSLLLPWAPPPPPSSDAPFEPPYKLEGGDPAGGEKLFFAESSKCSVCHKVGGKGGDVGPNLDRPRRRDLAWLFRSIAAPGDEVRPDYVAYTIATEDGRVAVGTVRAEGADTIRVLDTEGKATDFKRSEIQLMRPGSTSIMPVGLAGAIGEAGMRDLLAYLMADRPAK